MCRLRATGEAYAVKIISALAKRDEAFREAELLQRVQGEAKGNEVLVHFCDDHCFPICQATPVL